jgi:hypothetical protein
MNLAHFWTCWRVPSGNDPGTLTSLSGFVNRLPRVIRSNRSNNHTRDSHDDADNSAQFSPCPLSSRSLVVPGAVPVEVPGVSVRGNFEDQEVDEVIVDAEVTECRNWSPDSELVESNTVDDMPAVGRISECPL